MTTNNRIPSAKRPPKADGPSPNKINTLMELAGRKPAGPKQQSLDLNIERQAEINGLEMGVLSDGTPFLTGRGLASLCGVHHSVIADLTADWSDSLQKSRVSTIKDILSARGLSFEKPYVASWQKGNATFFAYPDSICLAVLEYYAFESNQGSRDVAIRNFRALAGHALREFIYVQLGYDPSTNVPQVWRQFHDRLSLVYNAVPAGYFGIFKEISEMIITLGQAGLHIDDSFVPDISVGLCWSKHWAANLYDLHYGERVKFDHRYPDYFPQSASNPQEAWCYPEAALGEFRRWFRETYIGDGKFEAYLLQKVEQKALPPSFAQLAIAAYVSE
jgi:hypothetical protein